MATNQHYLWASGHFLLLVSAFRCFLACIPFGSVPAWWYKACFTGALTSYAIVCQKSLGPPQASLAFIKRAMFDENVQYFLLAFFWWSSRPIAIALLPYTIFSLFHALTFLRTTLMPQFLPPSPPTNDGGPPQPHPLAKKLQSWVKSNYDAAMRAVAYIELIIFVRVLLGTVFFQNSLLSPVVFAHFLRQRYYQSVFTRAAVADTSHRIDAYVRRLGNPVIIGIWEKARMYVSRWGGNTLEPRNANGAAPRR